MLCWDKTVNKSTAKLTEIVSRFAPFFLCLRSDYSKNWMGSLWRAIIVPLAAMVFTAILGNLCGCVVLGYLRVLVLHHRANLSKSKNCSLNMGRAVKISLRLDLSNPSPGCRRPVCCPRTELVEVTEWTPAGHFRHSKFVGLRDNKDARRSCGKSTVSYDTKALAG